MRVQPDVIIETGVAHGGSLVFYASLCQLMGRGRVIGIALCLALGLAYFLVHSAAVALARTDILPPLVAAWSANFLFATLGLFLFLRART